MYQERERNIYISYISYICIHTTEITSTCQWYVHKLNVNVVCQWIKCAEANFL